MSGKEVTCVFLASPLPYEPVLRAFPPESGLEAAFPVINGECGLEATSPGQNRLIGQGTEDIPDAYARLCPFMPFYALFGSFGRFTQFPWPLSLFWRQ